MARILSCVVKGLHAGHRGVKSPLPGGSKWADSSKKNGVFLCQLFSGFQHTSCVDGFLLLVKELGGLL